MSDERPPALITPAEWRRPARALRRRRRAGAALVLLVVVGLGPLLWLAKSAITPTNDTITHPMGLFTHGAAWSNLREAWVERERRPLLLEHDRRRARLVALADRRRDDRRLRAVGAAPAIREADHALLLATLFVPAVVLLVPLYIEIVRPPIVHHSFIDTYWAVWLPAGASAFNVVLVYDDIRAISRQPERFTSRRGALVNDPLRRQEPDDARVRSLHLDPPLHADYRKLLNRRVHAAGHRPMEDADPRRW